MKDNTRIPTTVKLNPILYDELKVLSVRHKLTLQSFVEKCMFLYVRHVDFRQTINNFNMPVLNITGSI